MGLLTRIVQKKWKENWRYACLQSLHCRNVMKMLRGIKGMEWDENVEGDQGNEL